jgi:hypothetical protein
MPMHTSEVVTERRQQILQLLGEHLTVPEIAVKLRISKDQVYEDQKAIKKWGVKFLTTLGSSSLAYHYQVMYASMIKVNKDLWELVKTRDISDSDKIRAYKVIKEVTTELRELTKEGINLFTVEEIKQRISDLEKQTDNNKEIDSYMNLQLPTLDTNNDNIIIANTNTDNDNSQPSSDATNP